MNGFLKTILDGDGNIEFIIHGAADSALAACASCNNIGQVAAG